MVAHENGSLRFLSEYIEHFEFNDKVDVMFKIDIPRKVIIFSEDK